MHRDSRVLNGDPKTIRHVPPDGWTDEPLRLFDPSWYSQHSRPPRADFSEEPYHGGGCYVHLVQYEGSATRCQKISRPLVSSRILTDSFVAVSDVFGPRLTRESERKSCNREDTISRHIEQSERYSTSIGTLT